MTPHEALRQRVVVWFSCGVNSTVAAHRALANYRDSHRIEIVYCNLLKDEHPDNARYLKDVEKWLNWPISIISSSEFISVEQVWAKRKYMSGIAGAPCTVEMKKIPRFRFQQADDINIFGFAADERIRIDRFQKNNPELAIDWILLSEGITKAGCFTIVRAAKIRLPTLYLEGFKNNNCIGCVKATSPSYWNLTRKMHPEIFRRRAEQSREIGCRLTRLKGKRIFLDELPEGEYGRYKMEDISCGPECGETAK